MGQRCLQDGGVVRRLKGIWCSSPLTDGRCKIGYVKGELSTNMLPSVLAEDRVALMHALYLNATTRRSFDVE